MINDDLLAQGVAAAKAGRRDEARDALTHVVEADAANETAWLWLSGVTSDPDERRDCLEHVLAINPANPHARHGLELLAHKRPSPAQAAPPPEPHAPPLPRSLRGEPFAPPDEVFDQQEAAAATGATEPLEEEPFDEASLDPAAAAALALLREEAQRRAEAEAAAAASASAPGQPQKPVKPAEPPPPPITLKLPKEAPADPQAEEPCQYCGGATRHGDQSCPHCKHELTVPGQPREERSRELLGLVGAYALGAFLALVVGLLQITGLVSEALSEGAKGLPFPAAGVGAAAAATLIGIGGCVYNAFGLFRRRQGAYVAHIASMVVAGLLSIAALAAARPLAALMASQLAARSEGPPSALPFVMGAAVSLAVIGGMGYLTSRVRLDFFGVPARVSAASLHKGDNPYNEGIHFRDRGMWYMAAVEWELAAQKAPGDITIRRALGLAYARLGRHEQARETLRVALELAPSDPYLPEDLALVEQLAAGKPAAHR